MFSRRDFLRGMGSLLLIRAVNRNFFSPGLTALAASTPRKLALLVGIDDYGEGVPPLRGCLTDVELQKDLLLYRLGFQPADVLTLTGEAATREAIEAAFLEHLIRQARPGDVVVFHFSGYGARVGEAGERVLVPYRGGGDALPLENLKLLTRYLATELVTVVLDTGYAPDDLEKSGSLRFRSYPGQEIAVKGNESELWRELGEKYRLSPDPRGIWMTGGENAAESNGNGWNAGLFTYALTRHLWGTILPIGMSIVFSRSRGSLLQVRPRQRPTIETALAHPNAYNIFEKNTATGIAVVRNIIDEKTIGLSFRGLPAEVVENLDNNSVLISDDGEEIGLQIIEKKGLRGKARLLTSGEPPKVGRILKERLRVYADKPGLIVALDSKLSRIERVDATSAFAPMPPVSAVIEVGEKHADCVLKAIGSKDSTKTVYGLYSPAGEPIVGSLGLENEAVKTSVKRLQPRLENLLALKLWRLTLNTDTTRLMVGARLETGDGRTGEGEKLTVGTEIKFTIENRGERLLYGLIVEIDSERNTTIACTTVTAEDGSEKLSPLLVGAKSELTLPAKDKPAWKARGPAGLVENYVILSVYPLEKTFLALNNDRRVGEKTESVVPTEPLEVARALWEDLKLKEVVKLDSLNTVEGYCFDVNAWATLCPIYEVIR